MGGRRSNNAVEGEIVKPGYRDGRVRDSTMAHRYRFLWAVQEHVPEVLADLNRDVFPLFRALYREGNLREIGEVGCVAFNTSGEQIAMLCIKWSSLAEANKRGELWFHPTWKADFLDVPLNGDRLKFKNAMENWAAKYHLSAEPILEDAFSTLLFWIANPNGDHRHWLPHGHDRSPEEIANAPKFHLDDVWGFEPWPIVKKRLDQQIAEYRTAVREYCAKIGFDLDRMRDSYAHHEWLALFQCKKMSAARIQKWNQKHNHREVGPTAIFHGIARMAERVGLKIRRRRSRPSRSSAAPCS